MGTTVKIFIFGGRASGKTQIFNKITNTRSTFDLYHQPTISTSYAKVRKDDYELQVWDCDPSEITIRSSKSINPDIAIYCVDLSMPLNTNEIAKNIKLFKKCTQNKPAEIILVGTKADLQPQVSLEDFSQLLSIHNIQQGIRISSKDGTNTDQLLEQINRLYEEEQTQQILVSDVADSFFNNKNSSTTESKLPWEMSACEAFGWFCLPVLGWAYLVYYFIFNSNCYTTADADDSHESSQEDASTFSSFG